MLGHIRLPGHRVRWQPQEQGTLRRRLNLELQPNGLRLEEETVTDGNCGVDAVLRGLAGLGPGKSLPRAGRVEWWVDRWNGGGWVRVDGWVGGVAKVDFLGWEHLAEKLPLL